MVIKSLFRIARCATATGRAKQEQRILFLDAVNYLCQKHDIKILLNRGVKSSALTNYVLEDDLDDSFDVRLECVTALDYKIISFGWAYDASCGSLIDRLIDFNNRNGTQVYDVISQSDLYVIWPDSSLHEGSKTPTGDFDFRFNKRPAADIVEKLRKSFGHLAKAQAEHLADPKDIFFLRQEFDHNFSSIFEILNRMTPDAPIELRPRLADETIDARWNQFGSPVAQKKEAERIMIEYEKEYEAYLYRRAGLD